MHCFAGRGNLSLAGVAPRTAQTMMRHSRIELTMNTYTDSRLLDTATAVESVPLLRTLAPTLAPNLVQASQYGSIPDQLDALPLSDENTKKPSKKLGFTGFSEVEDTRLELVASCMPCKRSTN